MQSAQRPFLVHDTEPGVPAALVLPRPADAARLVVVAGPASGLELDVGACDTTIGRARGNALVLADVSVSRRHAVLRREGASFVIVDLESGNGTRVNGRRVRRAHLGDGDEVSFGDSLVRFADPKTARPAPAFRGRSAAVAATIVAGALAVAIWPARDAPAVGDGDDTATKNVTAPPVAPSASAPAATSASATIDVPPSTPAAAAEPAAHAESPPAAVASEPPRRGSVAPAVRAYLAGDVAAALRLGTDPGMVRDLQALEAARSEGAAHAAAGDTAAAIHALERAERLDRMLSGDRTTESTPGRQIRRTLSVLHERAAASAADADDQIPAVAAHLRAAVAYDEANAAARTRLEEAVAAARGAYFRAYVAKDSDPDEARRGFRIAAASLPLDDELGRKARRWLEQLDRRRR
jgi:FHA domain